MNIDEITNGKVIDHIQAGKAMHIYAVLGLDKLDCSVAIIKNAPSKKMGKKDIIKIDGNFHIDFDVLGYISPEATVNIIKNGIITEKMHMDLPERIVNIEKCKNPRCITSTEQEIDQIFVLSDRDKAEYRCYYCDVKLEQNNV